MTNDEINELITEAELDGYFALCPTLSDIDDFVNCLEKFAKLVASAEREACIKNISNILHGQEGCLRAIHIIRARD
jgi:hypothetical protein